MKVRHGQLLLPLFIAFSLSAQTNNQAPANNAPTQSTAPAPSTTPPASAAPQFKPLLAEDVYKNVEIMKGKEATKVLPMMLALRGLLGADCNYCHVPQEWDKEDLKPKQTTRLMFHMQAFINQSTFDGKERINCWTCHRNQPKPPAMPKTEGKPPAQVAAEMFIRFKPEQADKPVETVFHNIHIMKGMPTKQLPVAMAYVSESLGMRCVFCHNLDDFSSDEKQPKQMARKMFGMIGGIQKNFYNGGDLPIGCWNCHQGHEKPPEGWGG